MHCPVDAQLVDFINGRLHEELSLQLEKHLRSCFTCQARMPLLDCGDDTVLHRVSAQTDSKFDYVDEPECQSLLKFAEDLSQQPGWPYGEKTTVIAEQGNLIEGSPSSIGRYKIVRRLGAGAFGTVWLASDDEQLERYVAVKIAHAHRIKSPEDAERYQREARLLAKMEHPNIVPVHDSGVTDDGMVFIVSRFIKGRDLAAVMNKEKFPVEAAVNLIISIAKALDYMHSNGIVHRDIKPGNILIDSEGNAFLTDFGLAIREEEIAGNSEIVGTLAYMSPEQLSGDGHLTGPRSDIFSLGVLLFELLSSHRPFEDRTTKSQLGWMMDVPRLRDIDSDLPLALDRICLKAMQEKSFDRFGTAREFANELKQYLTDPLETLDEEQPATLVYRGLRAFRQSDEHFFCELLPGMRSSRGNPELVQFWLNRIQAEDTEMQPRIGVIYGTTGSGKSSLVNAAIIPKLDSDITVISIQASPKRTETDLADKFKKVFLNSEEVTSLPEICRHIRKRQPPFANQRILIVIDQFEQWLHGRQIDMNLELVQALRQCDGDSIQCLLIVRDDFWVELSSFMHAVEEPMSEDENMMAVKPFSIEHAQKVLFQIGEAVKGKESNAVLRALFVERGIELIQTDGEVPPVRLALFVEMTKDLPWEPETIRHFKDLNTLGYTYIKQLFNTETCSRRHRSHIPAIKLLLAALLPEQGNSLKGQELSLKELRTICGYEDSPERFTQLIDLLDRSFKIISTVNHGEETTDPDALKYQLTHDYLVPAIRAWLEEEEVRTYSGRARIKLRDRTSLWRMKREARQLPGVVDFVNIATGTKRSEWTTNESTLMKTAFRRIASQTAGLAAVIVLFSFLFSNQTRNDRDAEILSQLTQVSASDVPNLLDELEQRLPRMQTQIIAAYEAENVRSHKKNRLALAKLTFDEVDVIYLQQQLLEASADEFEMVVAEMMQREMSFHFFANEMKNEGITNDSKFRAACALLASSTEAPPTQEIVDALVTNLVQQEQPTIIEWMDWLSEYEEHLTPNFKKIFKSKPPTKSTANAAIALSRLLRTDKERYLPLLLSADEKQLPILCDAVIEDSSAYSQELKDWLADNADAETGQSVNALTSLVHFGDPESLKPYLKRSKDPELRSLLLHKLAATRVDPQMLLDTVNANWGAAQTAAMLLALGSCEESLISKSTEQQLLEKTLALFQKHPDSEVHSAAEWVLNMRGEKPTIPSISIEEAIKTELNWFVTPSGYTMVVPDEKARVSLSSEDLKKLNLSGPVYEQSWTFAIATKEVDVQHFLEFKRDHDFNDEISRATDSPINLVNYYGAIEYCNWLTASEMGAGEQCYEKVNEKLYLKENFLELKGYRLPLDGEWILAARGGALTRYPFGTTNELLEKYAWHLANSQSYAHPSGTLKPNQIGLFDICGNIQEVCHAEDALFSSQKSRVVPFRGGSFESQVSIFDPRGSMEINLPIEISRSSTSAHTGFRFVQTLESAQ